MPCHNVIVCGLGVMGSATLRELAQRGVHALGIERFAPGHDRGSSHGATRIIRLSYFEHPSYVPLLRRAYALWHALEAESGRNLLAATGIAEIGPPDGALVQGTLASARLHALPHEMVPAAELMRRYPAFRLPSHYVAVMQPDGGMLAAEQSIEAMLALAQIAGAEVRAGIGVRAIEPRAGGVRVRTDHGDLDAAAAVVTAGPWLKHLLPELPARLRITRQVMAWFAPRKPAVFAPACFPVFLIESRHGMHYGFPLDSDGRVKVAKHHHRDEAVDPDLCDRRVSAADVALIRDAVTEHIPAADGALAQARTCLYTVTDDGDFLIDTLPGFHQVIVGSPCSGHGFKFAPVIGEILADLATRKLPQHDISRFRLSRVR